MSEHTKLPWRVGDLKQWSIETNVRPIIAEEKFAVAWAAGWAESDDKSVAAPEEAEANAALIVRAVNSLASNEAKIDALTKALEGCRGFFTANMEAIFGVNHDIPMAAHASQVMRRIDAALSSHTEQEGGGRG